MKDIRTVGVIGLGKMGMPMARLLRERGFAVTGYDVALPAVKARRGQGYSAGQFAEGSGGGERSRHHRGRLRFRSRIGDLRR